MSNFTVSARKYRPGTFDMVMGQEHITNTLKNAIRQNHVGHSFLFCGQRGVGKTTCARILAKALNCENLTADIEPCNECDNCVAFKNNASFNVFELDAASNNSVDDIRSLNEQVRYGPQAGKYKIYIIDEVHMLSAAAFNAFLKTLEEPPSYAIFILATTERHKILPTILSRCQVFDFKRISVPKVIDQLHIICKEEGIEAEEQGLFVIAQKGEGSMRDSLSLFDRLVSFTGKTLTYKEVTENLSILDYEYYFKLTDYLRNGNSRDALLLFNDVLDKGFDGHHFLNGISDHLRDLLVCKDKVTVRLLEVSEEVKSLYAEQSSTISMSFLLSALNILNQFDINYKQSHNQRLHVELALLKLCHLEDALNFSMTPAIETGEKKKPELEKSTSSKKEEAAPVTEVEIPKYTGDKTFSAAIQTEALLNKPETPSMAENEIEGEENLSLSFDEVLFIAAWNAYAETKKEVNPATYASLKMKQPEFVDGSIIIKADNESQRKMLMEERINILDYLRVNHEITGLRIDISLESASTTVNPNYLFSHEDRFKAMAEKNPILLQLKKELGLDFE